MLQELLCWIDLMQLVAMLWFEKGEKMDERRIAELCDARDTLCEFCDMDDCEKCIVTQLINDAFNELDELGQ